MCFTPSTPTPRRPISKATYGQGSDRHGRVARPRQGVRERAREQAGYTVYATGRTTADLGKASLPIRDCRQGQRIIPCSLDQKDDDAVQAFVSKVKAEAGKVDLLVGSAYQGLEAQKPYFAKRFYERPIAEFDAAHAERWRALVVRDGVARRADHGRGEAGAHRADLLDGRRAVPLQHAVRRSAHRDGPADRRHGGGAHGARRAVRDALAAVVRDGEGGVPRRRVAHLRRTLPRPRSPCRPTTTSRPNGKVVHRDGNCRQVLQGGRYVERDPRRHVHRPRLFKGRALVLGVRAARPTTAPTPTNFSHRVGGGWGVTNSEAAAGWFPGHAGGA